MYAYAYYCDGTTIAVNRGDSERSKMTKMVKISRKIVTQSSVPRIQKISSNLITIRTKMFLWFFDDLDTYLIDSSNLENFYPRVDDPDMR